MSERNRNQFRCRIEGTFRGQSWVYEDPIGSDGSQYAWYEVDHEGKEYIDPSEFWWSDGNMSCDCNRMKFLPSGMSAALPRDDEGFVRCGNTIHIDRIVSLDPAFPDLVLNETAEMATVPSPDVPSPPASS